MYSLRLKECALAGMWCVFAAWLVFSPQAAWGQKAVKDSKDVKAAKTAGPKDVVLVEAKGEGTTKEEALKAALRDALEKGGKQEIFSDSKVENFQLMHDTIISRAQGIVKDYEIVKQKKGVGGSVIILIKAKVSKSVLAKSWGEVQNVLKQIGRPKILVSITERIDGQEEEQSILETLIEKPLLKSGFEMVAGKAAAAIRKKEADDAAADENIAKIQAIAKDFDAQIFITGTANANEAGIESLYGAPVAFYNCDAQVKVYYTDTARLMASEGLPNTRGGARGRKEFSPQAGKMALANSSQKLVDSLYAQIMERWATDISAGGELILEIEGMSFKKANDIKKLIA
ncbi:MAG: hypothetical protein JSV03_05240 [Planctomycetota bacterium]|nr:MAG: hypothetical protein JSV03_05240 [Planctomycetota bacterium]